MKYFHITLAFLLFTLPVLAQSKRTVVRGRFAEDAPKTVSLKTYTSVANRIDGEELTLTSEAGPDTNKSFGFVIYTDEPLSFSLLSDDKLMFRNKYLAPGDSLYFTLKKTGTTIEGSCKECIGFQFAFDKRYDNPDSAAVFRDAWKNLSSIEFAEYMKQRHDGHLRFFEEYFSDNLPPALFKRVFTATEDLDFIINISQYPWRSPNNKSALLDTAYLAYIKHMNLNNPDYVLSYRYEHFLRELPYGMWVSLTTRGSSYFNNGLQVRDSLAKQYFKGKAYDYALYHILNDRLRGTKEQTGKPGFEKYYKQTEAAFTLMSSHFKDKTLSKRLLKRLRELKQEKK